MTTAQVSIRPSRDEDIPALADVFVRVAPQLRRQRESGHRGVSAVALASAATISPTAIRLQQGPGAVWDKSRA